MYYTYPLGGFPSEYCHDVWYEKTKDGALCSYLMVKKIEDMFIRFDRIHERDGQTPHYG